ncbi:N-acetyl-gamma-glutamyl-phosphate reductase [Durusdinium trenchii]|uniref:N-acetyl-gamma-glutamyl-phosphate reductase n=1 Tax=Durusdinium trenchii TaxID=1381693 RepID=A0ABP0HKP7_9DINO
MEPGIIVRCQQHSEHKLWEHVRLRKDDLRSEMVPLEEPWKLLKSLGSFKDNELRSIFDAVGVVADGCVSMEDLFDWMQDDDTPLAARVKAQWIGPLTHVLPDTLHVAWCREQTVFKCRLQDKRDFQFEDGFAVSNIDIDDFAIQLQLELIEPTDLVDTMILGLDLCPFAQAPAQRNGLKVLSSTGCSGEDVLEDLQFEAEILQAQDPEMPATTLLVCGHVPEWLDFNQFHEFYARELQNGRVLSRMLGLEVAIVAFHPDCASSELVAGGEVAVQYDGETCLAQVLKETDREMLSVRLLGRIIESTLSEEEEGEDVAIQAFDQEEEVLCRRSDVLWALDTDSGRSGADAREALARAPRPVLHLLRSNDLARVAQEEREEVYRHNDHLLDRMGIDAFEELIRQCG